jgi:hypothetical protein
VHVRPGAQRGACECAVDQVTQNIIYTSSLDIALAVSSAITTDVFFLLSSVGGFCACILLVTLVTWCLYVPFALRINSLHTRRDIAYMHEQT